MGAKKQWMAVLVIIMVMLISGSGCNQKEEKQKETAISIEIFPVETMDMSKQVSYVGTISAQNEVMIVPEMQTKVTAVLVKPGDRVRAGQVLIRLDSSDFQAGLAQAQAAVAQAKAAKSTNDIRLQQAQANYDRIKTLHDGGAVSDVELETASTNLQLLNSGVAEAGIAQAEAGLSQVQKNINKCSVISPINGVVGSIDAQVGEFPRPGMAIASVSSGGDMEAEIMVSESEIPYVKAGALAQVNVQAANQQGLSGQVLEVSNIADQQRHTYRVKVGFTNVDDSIKSGMSAHVLINTEMRPSVKVVPINAVLGRAGESLVYVVDDQNRVHERTVLTGMSNHEFIEILEGLEIGEPVVTKGNSLVNESTLVKIIGSEASR